MKKQFLNSAFMIEGMMQIEEDVINLGLQNR